MVVLAGSACSDHESVEPENAGAATRTAEWANLDPPAADQAFAPNLTVAGDQVLLTWLERLAAGQEAPRHRLLFSRLVKGTWSPPATVAEGDDFFANWADFPEVVEASDGTLVAHWLAKTAADTYAYSAFLARSEDGGATWTPMGKLNDDATATEHGFVSLVREDVALRAFWLDGRQTVDGEAMTLRSARVDERVGPSELLDEKVCDCCGTDAGLTSEGPVVVFRDRSDEEVRDIAIVRRTPDGWSAPQAVHADNWTIAGCPVNGPEIVTEGRRAAVAWFTAAQEVSATKVAFSEDAGASFDPPVLVDGEASLGRVDVVLDRDDAIVSWLAVATGEGEVRLRRVAADGRVGPSLTAGKTAASRASGFPRLAKVGDRIYLAWVETGIEQGRSHIRLREIPTSAIPAAG